MAKQDYFENAPGKDEAMPEKPGMEGDGEDKGDEQTYLVQKEAYPDAKPGDTFKMRVVRVHADEMECSVEKEDEQAEGDEPMGDEAEMPAGMAGGDSGGNSMYD